MEEDKKTYSDFLDKYKHEISKEVDIDVDARDENTFCEVIPTKRQKNSVTKFIKEQEKK